MNGHATVDQLFNRGCAQARQGSPEAAIVDFDAVLQQCPEFVGAYVQRGIAHAAVNNLAKAIADFDQAIALKPDLALAYRQRGMLYLHLGEKCAALEDFDRAIAHNARDAIAYMQRGLLHEALGNPTRSAADLDRAAQLQPRTIATYLQQRQAQLPTPPPVLLLPQRSRSLSATYAPTISLDQTDPNPDPDLAKSGTLPDRLKQQLFHGNSPSLQKPRLEPAKARFRLGGSRWPQLSRSPVSPAIVACLLMFAIGFGSIVIQDFTTPLIGEEDINIWEYMGYYLAQNLRFVPWPQVALQTNQAFYPYGVNSVFQGWGLERDLIYALLYSTLGPGGWLQDYYMASVLITALGTFWLLRRDYGDWRAIGAGLLVSGGNFYALHKFPHHLDTAIVHWTTLSLVADFLLVKRVVLRQAIALRLVLARIALLVLAIGQGIGYVAGFALLSFSISGLYLAGLVVYRLGRYALKTGITSNLANGRFLKDWAAEWHQHPQQILSLLGITLVASFFYLPLAIQIAQSAQTFDFTGLPIGSWWANPLRMLIPYWPKINPSIPWETWLRDQPEGLGAASPGWSLLILGIVGLWQSRRHLGIYGALLILLGICLSYHPDWFPILKVFPWFAFNRVAGRSSILYPVILTLMALGIRELPSRSTLQHGFTVLLLILLCTEISTAYALPNSRDRADLSTDFYRYMQRIAAQPGEAILDWPFCVAGGNTIGGRDGLCPYAQFTKGIYALQRFHHKKVMGQYFGRLHPQQIAPYLQAGWPQLFHPNHPDPHRATQQAQCFTAREWQFFQTFYILNDFAGLNLYVDLLRSDCLAEFHRRLGSPILATKVPEVGQVEFIPKPPKWRNQVDRVEGRRLRFSPSAAS